MNPRDSGATAKAETGERLQWRSVLRFVVSGAIVLYLLSQIDLAQTWQAVAGASVGLVLLMIAVMVGDRPYAAYRWQVVVRVQHPDVRLGTLTRIVFGSNFYGLYFTGAGIDLLRVLGLARVTGDPAMAFASVLVDRIMGVLVLCMMTVLGIAFLGGGQPVITAWAFATLGVLILGCASLVNPNLRKLFFWFLRPGILAPIRMRLEKLHTRLDSVLERNSTVYWALLLAVGMQMLRIISVWVGALALNIDLPFLYFVAYVPIILFIQMLPIAIASIGPREAAFVYFFGLAAVEQETALALGLFFFLGTVLAALPGVLVPMKSLTPREVLSQA